MADPPWVRDPVVGDYEHGGFNQSVPADNAATAAPAPATGQPPWASDPVARPDAPTFTAQTAAPLVDNRVNVGEFGDDAGPHEAAEKLAPQDEATLLGYLRVHDVDGARRFASAKGFGGPDNFEEIMKSLDKGQGLGTAIKYDIPHMPDGGAGASFVRGVGSDIPFYAKIASGMDALGAAGDGRPSVWNGSSFGDAYRHDLDINSGILDADEANHPHARLTGAILGGVLIPTGMEGVGLNAGKAVLAAGGTMREARAAALAAVRNRASVSGAVYGGAHSAGESDGSIGDMAARGALGAIEGGAGAFGLTAAGQTVAERAPQAWAAVKSALKPVGDMIGQAEPSPAEEAPNYVQIARDLGIQRTPATNSRTGFATVMQSGLGALPGGSPIAAGAERESAGLAAAARGVANDVGTVSDRQGAGEALAQGAQQYKATSGLQGKSLYTQRDALIGGSDTPVPTDQAAAAIQDMAAKFPTSPAIQQLREHPAIRAIGGALPGEPTTEEVPTGLLDASGKPITRTVESGQEPLTLGEVTEALSHVRGVQRNLAAQSMTTSPVLARVNQLEQGLKGDVMTAAQNADVAAGRTPGAEGSAVKAQRDADAFWADRSTALNGALKRPLQSAADDTKVSGEGVYNQIYGDMNQKSGNLARLRDTWFRLPDQAKSTFAATAIDDLGRATPGAQNDLGNAWSFNSFLTNVNKLSPQARNIVFGPKADMQLNQVAAYANRLKQLDRARNFSNTAQKYFAGAFMATVGGAVMHGNLGTAAEAAAALPATWGGAKLLLATPGMRDWTVQAMKAVTGAAQGNTNETAFKVLTKRLSSIAAADPTIADQALGLQRHIMNAVNDNFSKAGPLAASPNQGPSNSDQQAQGK